MDDYNNNICQCNINFGRAKANILSKDASISRLYRHPVNIHTPYIHTETCTPCTFKLFLHAVKNAEQKGIPIEYKNTNTVCLT